MKTNSLRVERVHYGLKNLEIREEDTENREVFKKNNARIKDLSDVESKHIFGKIKHRVSQS